MISNKKFLLFIIALLVILVVVWKFSFSGDKAWYDKKAMAGFAIPVEVEVVKERALSKKISAVGDLTSDESVIIRPEIAGLITKIHFKEGDWVDKGQLLIEIDDSVLKAELEKVTASFQLSKLTYLRNEGLRQRGAISEQKKDDAEARYKEMKASKDLAQARFDKTKIYAPFAGLIGFRKVSAGNYLDIGREITDLEKIDLMKIDFSVPEKYFSLINSGKNIDLKVDAYPEKTFVAEIYAISPQIDVDTRNVNVRAIVNNQDKYLRPGMFAHLTIEINRKDNAIVIPEEALIPKGNKFNVFKVVAGKAAPAEISVGSRIKGKVEVTEGLKKGDVVVTAGHIKLRPGQPVSPVNLANKKPAGKTGQRPKGR